MSSVCIHPHDSSRAGNAAECSPACFDSSKQLYLGLVARSQGAYSTSGTAGHAAAGRSTAFRNRHVSREFLAFREPPSSELIPPGVMSVCSVNDLQARQLLPRQLIASALELSQESYPSSRNCNSSHHQPTISAAGFHDNPHF